jgi:hypothetical protein
LARRIAEAQASPELTQCAHFQAVVADRIGINSPAQVRG